MLVNLPVSVNGSLVFDTRSRAGSLDTTHTEEFEVEQENGRMYLEGEGRNDDTNQSNQLRRCAGNDDSDHHHEHFDSTCERQKGIELAAETMWEGIATIKNDLVSSTSEAMAMTVVEMK